MKKRCLLSILISAAILSACGSGGGGNNNQNTGGNNNPSPFPAGQCFTSNGYLDSKIYQKDKVEDFFSYTYSPTNGLQIIINEKPVPNPESSVFSAKVSNLNKTLPNNICAMDDNLLHQGKEINFQGKVMYIEDCKVSLDGNQLKFSGRYGIFEPGQNPEIDVATRFGNIDFTCNNFKPIESGPMNL